MKRKNFLKLGIGIPLLGMFSFKSASKKEIIKKNPIITFTPENLSEFNVGTYVINDKADVIKNNSYACTVVWKLVYQMKYNKIAIDKYNTKIELPKYGLCNALTDGWIHWIGDKQELCNYLNTNPFKQNYRILTPEELIHLIKNRSNQKQIVRHVI